MCCVEEKCEAGWAEQLPEGCPDPKTTFDPSGETLYRMVAGAAATIEDFRSHQDLDPNRYFSSGPCVSRSLSLWDSMEKCERLKKGAAHRGKRVAAIVLPARSGTLLRKNNGHYSWWRCGAFDVIAAVTAVY